MDFSLKKLPVSIMRYGKKYVAYSPALDISTQGKSEKDAQKKFAELALIFFEEIGETGTTGEVLEELGWKKVRKNWTPPKIYQKNVGVKIPVAA